MVALLRQILDAMRDDVRVRRESESTRDSPESGASDERRPVPGLGRGAREGVPEGGRLRLTGALPGPPQMGAPKEGGVGKVALNIVKDVLSFL